MKYLDAGVNVENGELVAKRIKKNMQETWGNKIVKGVSGFLAAYEDEDDYLIGATDGVGTKLKIAFSLNKHETIGEDLVAMCVNDLVRVGAKPLFFLDYLAIGKLNVNLHEKIMHGIINGCKKAGCALIGGESAEMPDMYKNEEYDLAGFSVGRVKKNEILDEKNVKIGDILIGIESTGIHSNGLSLARKVFKDFNEYVPEFKKTVGEELLTPTKIYVKPVLSLIKNFSIKSIAHITGGGINNKLPKALPNLGAKLYSNWQVPKIFQKMKGKVSLDEMRKTFNMGIGMILIVNSEQGIIEFLKKNFSLNAYIIGRVIEKKGVYYD